MMAKTRVYRKVIEEGPCNLTDDVFTISNLRVEERHKVRKFRPSNSSGSVSVPTGWLDSVHYHVDIHDPEEVVEVWLERNEDRIEDIPDDSLHTMISSYGEEFKEVSRELFGPFEKSHGPGGGRGERSCPLCGAEDLILARHLPECPER